MNISTLIIDNLAIVDGSEHHYEFTLKGSIALNHNQVKPLQEKFNIKYYLLSICRNWGTGAKYDIVIGYIVFKINLENEDEFRTFIESLREAQYKTENNFDYYINSNP